MHDCRCCLLGPFHPTSTHWEESAIYDLLHTWAHRHLWLANVTVTHREVSNAIQPTPRAPKEILCNFGFYSYILVKFRPNRHWYAAPHPHSSHYSSCYLLRVSSAFVVLIFITCFSSLCKIPLIHHAIEAFHTSSGLICSDFHRVCIALCSFLHPW